MLSFDASTHQFNLRVAGMLRHEERILIQRAIGDDFWTLPGGRVEAGEDAAVSLAREFREELEVEVQVGSLAVILENFFEYLGRPYHELGLYFLTSVPEASLLQNYREPFIGAEPNLEFVWAEVASISNWHLLPDFLSDYLGGDIDGIRHVIQRDKYSA